MTIALFSVPTPQSQFYKQRYSWPTSSSNKTLPLTLTLCSPSTISPPPDELAVPHQSTNQSVSVSDSGCKACGKEEVENGCNGEGRIQGGIATVPGFGWWPIKAYRPCPAFVASGGRYRRQGQSMDQVVSGSSGKKPTEDSKPSKKV